MTPKPRVLGSEHLKRRVLRVVATAGAERRVFRVVADVDRCVLRALADTKRRGQVWRPGERDRVRAAKYRDQNAFIKTLI